MCVHGPRGSHYSIGQLHGVAILPCACSGRQSVCYGRARMHSNTSSTMVQKRVNATWPVTQRSRIIPPGPRFQVNRASPAARFKCTAPSGRRFSSETILRVAFQVNRTSSATCKVSEPKLVLLSNGCLRVVIISWTRTQVALINLALCSKG